MRKQKIAIVGADGKMGKLICERLCSKYQIIKITENKKLKELEDISLMIDFANADSSVMSAKWCARHCVPLIIGSTGQNEAQNQEIEKSSKSVPILKCSNFSLGIKMIKSSLDCFCVNDISDISIFETHSKTKKDIPSGTAKTLQSKIQEMTGQQVQVLAERAGGGAGTHVIRFYLNNEIIELKHIALSRSVFVDGLEKCLEPMMHIKTARLYSIEEILN